MSVLRVAYIWLFIISGASIIYGIILLASQPDESDVNEKRKEALEVENKGDIEVADRLRREAAELHEALKSGSEANELKSGSEVNELKSDSEANELKYICVYPVEIGNSDANFVYAGVDDCGRLVEEPWDRGLALAGMSKKIKIISQESDFDPLTELSDEIEVSVFTTDSRVMFYCEKYDKGSKYWGIGGGAVLGAVMTGVSKSRAKARTAGTVMVGHIRYEWLQSVAFHKKTSWIDDEDSLTLVYTDSKKSKWVVLIEFPKNTDTEAIARRIFTKACNYKLSMQDDKSVEQRELLSKYCRGEIATGFESAKLFAYTAPDGEVFRPAVEVSQGG